MEDRISTSNNCLCSLCAEDFDLIQPHLTPCVLRHGDTLHRQLEQASHVYFPSDGVISFLVTLSDGCFIEAGMCGLNGVVGAATALGGKLALNRAVVQMAGSAQRISADVLRDLAGQSPSLRRALFHSEQAAMAQAQQIAACNAKHDLEARLARWLMQANDLVGRNKIELIQESLAQMLGVQRTSVSAVATHFQVAGIIKCCRGRIEIRDVDALRTAACECYLAINQFYEMLVDWAPGTLGNHSRLRNGVA